MSVKTLLLHVLHLGTHRSASSSSLLCSAVTSLSLTEISCRKVPLHGHTFVSLIEMFQIEGSDCLCFFMTTEEMDWIDLQGPIMLSIWNRVLSLTDQACCGVFFPDVLVENMSGIILILNVAPSLCSVVDIVRIKLQPQEAFNVPFTRTQTNSYFT